MASLEVSGFTKDEARQTIDAVLNSFSKNGIEISIDGKKEVLDPKNIELALPSTDLAYNAWLIGRAGKWHEQLLVRLNAPFAVKIIRGYVKVNEQKLRSELTQLAAVYALERKDVRYDIKGKEVSILYDTRPGKVLDEAKAQQEILEHLARLDISPVNFSLDIDRPRADPAFGEEAKRNAEAVFADPLTLSYKNQQFKIAPEKIGSWITSEYEGKKLVPGFSKKLISEYVVTVAEKIDIPPQNPTVKVEEGRVVAFIPPKQGRAILQDETIGLIISTLKNRASGKEIMKELSLPVAVKKPIGEGTSADLGVTELIGKATTPFTGSPQNRIHNINNGARFLSGLLIAPGEEFSTIGALGNIDNTTGYLPELVIKGDETIPEFGGGLCQVSTTLFRSVMNAGLPVIERRNHSYRVPYYERDGEGNLIGPGLDATIYDPWPDLKFKNDTEAHILIQSSLEGDKLTFELYGTSDDRKSFIDGPYTLKETPPPDAVYLETEELSAGETKKIDTAHPGGTATATYKIEYSDGRVDEQEFKSYYRPWPEKWLVGTATSTLTQ